MKITQFSFNIKFIEFNCKERHFPKNFQKQKRKRKKSLKSHASQVQNVRVKQIYKGKNQQNMLHLKFVLSTYFYLFLLNLS